MIIDPLNRFQLIKEEVLKKFPGSRVYGYGSRTRTGWKIKKLINKLDFDIIVCNEEFCMDPHPDYINLLKEFRTLSNYLLEKYVDEFDRPLDVDFRFTNAKESTDGIEI